MQRDPLNVVAVAYASENAFAELLDSLRASISGPHTVDSMAKRAHMSKRTFARRLHAITGTTPHRWLQRERARQAQQLLDVSATGPHR